MKPIDPNDEQRDARRPGDARPGVEHPEAGHANDPDPDRDFNERDQNYLHEVVRRLKATHSDTLRLRLNARTRLAQAEEEERELWLSFEDYLTETALWYQKKTGESQLHTPHGILNIFEQSGRVQVEDMDALQEWVQSHLCAVLSLAMATARYAPSKLPRHRSHGSTSPLPPPPEVPRPPVPKPSPESPTKVMVTRQLKPDTEIPDSEDPDPYNPAIYEPNYPWEEKGIDRSFVGASRYEIEPLLAAIWGFHRATGILPAGCQMGPSRTVVRLG
jgi:hypothetical protein